MFHYVDTGIRHFLTPQKFAKRFTGSPQHDRWSGDTVFMQNRQYFTLACSSIYALYRSKTQVFTYGSPTRLIQTFSQMNFTNHSRQNMAVFKMEVVIRSIQIGRHHCDIICSILKIKTFTHFQSGYLGYGVWLISIFQRRSQQRIFFHGLFCIAGINTGTTQEEQLLHSVTKTLSYHILLNLQILIDKISTI